MIASRHIHIQLFLAVEEMRELLDALQPVELYNASHIGDGEKTSTETFLEAYRRYYENFLEGRIVIDRPLFSLAISRDPDALVRREVKPKEFLWKVVRPVLQMRAHFYSILEGKMHPMTLGKNNQSWGVQISFPLIYRDEEEGKTYDTIKT